MRSLLIVLAIAIGAIALSVLLSKSKDLTPSPMDRDEARKAAADAKEAKARPANTATEPFSPPREGAVNVQMTVDKRGDVTMELYPKAAPKTVAHFTELIRKGFYDGMKFHRVVPNFVAQAGDPAQRQTAFADARLAGSTVPFETNDLKHVVGTLGVALTSPASDTGTSQFFINVANNHSLDGEYCVFGKVTGGMDVVNKIAMGDVITRMVVK